MKIIKLIVATLAAAAAGALMCFVAHAEQAADENRERENFHRSGMWGYTLLEDNTAAISKYYGDSKYPTVPEEIDGCTVTAISGGWYIGEDGKPVLYGNIHGISYADDGMIADSQVYSPFSENTEIKSVTIPDSVKWIGAISFRNCISLKKVILPSELEFIGNNCFDGCSSLESISIPDSVEYIDQEAFKNCLSLRSADLPNAHYEHSVFENCSSLREITLPSGMTELPPFMFSGCTELASVSFPEGMTTIGDSSFSGCTSLAAIALPDSLREIRSSAFFDCTSLESVEVGTLETLGSSAFANCGLKTLYLPETLVRIGENAFGKTSGGVPIEGFVLSCPEASAVLSYAEENGIYYETVQSLDDGLGGDIEIRYPIDPELLFKIVIGVIIAAALAVLIVIILMINNQRTADLKEADEYLGADGEE